MSKYFDRNELSDLINFLNYYADNYFKIVKLQNQIICCGGHYIKHSEKIFGIAWVIIKRYSLGNTNFPKISDIFFKHILTNIKNESFNYDILINTTQLLEKILKKFDFVTEQIIKNGFNEKLDYYIMKRKLN